MGQIWDSTPTRTTGKHRAPSSRSRRDINRRAAIRLTIAAVLLATLLAGLAQPAGLVAASYYLGLPVAIVAGAALAAHRTGRLAHRAVRR